MASASAAVRAMIRLARCGSSVGMFRPATRPTRSAVVGCRSSADDWS